MAGNLVRATGGHLIYAPSGHLVYAVSKATFVGSFTDSDGKVFSGGTYPLTITGSVWFYDGADGKIELEYVYGSPNFWQCRIYPSNYFKGSTRWKHDLTPNGDYVFYSHYVPAGAVDAVTAVSISGI